MSRPNTLDSTGSGRTPHRARPAAIDESRHTAMAEKVAGANNEADTAQHVRRKRASKACLSCRSRKVRCDVARSAGPCTNCRLDSASCITPDRRTVKSRWRSFKGLDGVTVTSASAAQPTPGASTISSDPNTDSSAHGDIASAADVSVTIEVMRASRSPQDGPPTSTGQDAQERRSPSEFAHEPCVDDDPTTTFHHRASSANGEDRPAGNTTCTSAAYEVPPKCDLPAYVQPASPWMEGDDLNYLRQKGALTIPPSSLRNRLLRAFVEYVYAYMPIVDLNETLGIIAREDGLTGKINLLLLQAIMFAGSAFVELEALRAAGYQSRRAARRSLFARVRLLYDFDWDSSNVTQIQSLLLMTYWWLHPHEQKDLWYWMGVVVNLSRTSGLHQNPDADLACPSEKRLRKRIWWSVFMRDQFTAMGMRRPVRIKRSDHHIPMLTLSDFACEPVPTDQLCILQDCPLIFDGIQRKQLAAMCIEMCKLSVHVSGILAQHYSIAVNTHDGEHKRSMLFPIKVDPSSPTKQLRGEELRAWSKALPTVCKYDSTSSLSGCEAQVMIVHKAMLEMMHATVTSMLHCPHILPSAPWSKDDGAASWVMNDLDELSRTSILNAAGDISGICQDLQTLDLVRYLPTTGVTALLPALIIYIVDIRSRSRTSCQSSMRNYCRSIGTLQKLGEVYHSAEAAAQFLEATRTADVLVPHPRDAICAPQPAMQHRQMSRNAFPPRKDLEMVESTDRVGELRSVLPYLEGLDNNALAAAFSGFMHFIDGAHPPSEADHHDSHGSLLQAVAHCQSGIDETPQIAEDDASMEGGPFTFGDYTLESSTTQPLLSTTALGPDTISATTSLGDATATYSPTIDDSVFWQEWLDSSLP